MPSFTKQAITDTFLRLLLRKPFRKITVRDIVEECGVNRTTFYYYYQDIYAIIEDLLAGILAPYAAELLDEGSPDALRDTSDFIRIHRRALKGLWDGLGQEEIRRYVMAVLREPIEELVRRLAEGLAVTREERVAVSLFVQEMVLGLLRLYLFEEVPTGVLLGEAARGGVRLMLENFEKMRKGDGSHE